MVPHLISSKAKVAESCRRTTHSLFKGAVNEEPVVADLTPKKEIMIDYECLQESMLRLVCECLCKEIAST